MKKSIKVLFIMCLALGFAFGGVSWVGAQEDSDNSDEFTLEEVTVTAQKRKQDLQKVANNVDVIQGYELTEMGMTDLSQALRNISNALVNPAGEELNVTIRAMDYDGMPGDAMSQVAVTVDGSFSGSFGVGTAGIFDMERIEVLAGPQGTLYSRNSAGGVVNMISNNPTTEDVKTSGSVEMGNYNLVNVQGVVNVPLSNSFAARAAFISTVRDGYANNGLSDADDRSLRFKLGYTPTENFSAILTYEYTRIGGKSQGDGYEAFEDEDDVDDPWTNDSPGDLFHGYTQTDRYYMNLDWTTPIGTVTFLPSYSDTDRRLAQAAWVSITCPGPGSPPWITECEPGVSAMSGGGDYQTSQYFVSPQWEKSYELRLAAPEDFFMEFMVGLYSYEREWKDKQLNYEEYYYDEETGEGYVVPRKMDEDTDWGIKGSKSEAIFANATYPVTDRFRVAGGYRYTTEEETSSEGEPRESSHPDYKGGLEYDVGDSTMLWVDYSTGFQLVRGGGSRGRDQKTKAYQAGSKSRFFDNRLQLNASAFFYDYTNFNVSDVADPVEIWEDGEYVRYSPSGVGDAEIYGIDISSNFVITNVDRLNLSVSYLKADVAEVFVTYTNQAGGESPELPPFTLPSGLPLNNAPEWSVVANYQHRFDLPTGAKITPNITLNYTDEYLLAFQPDATNVPEGMDVDKVNTEPASIMGDVSLNYSSASGKWTLNGYVKNITDHAQKTGFTRGDMRLGAPRTYGAVLSVNF